MERSLRRGWIGTRGELSQSLGRIAQPKLGCLAQPLRKRVELVIRTEPRHRRKLPLGRAVRTDEVGVIRVREPICARSRLCDDGALLERQHGLGSAHHREQRLDGIPALRVRDGVCPALCRGQLDSFRPRQAGEQRGGRR